MLLSPLAARAAENSWPVESYFRQILEGFRKNAQRTSGSWAVCDFEGGTLKPASVARNGKTYDSVTRMLPALSAWALRTGEGVDVLRSIYTSAFDPAHPDYWGAPPPDRQHQFQVEASVVAWALWLARDLILPQLSSASRRNIQMWLEACTRRPVRSNNWAWFTAVNQAVRLDLAHRWPEFSGDAQWMLDDIRFLDSLAAPGSDGWYSDSPKEPAYDYYNFWVFASHFLYWNRIVGGKYPEWSAKFTLRLKQFLEAAPYFFGANGAHPLYGRSLIYRWAVLTPLVLAYEQGLWPHGAGLLKRIVRLNIEFFWKLGGFDGGRGKLLETLSPAGSRAIDESYIDNGHPYWCMQAFALWAIPRGKAFWSAAEEPLPVERRSFLEPLRGPKILLAGDKRTGEVRWLIAANGHNDADYRSKYTKFSYSSGAPWGTSFDNALLFRAPDGTFSGQAGVDRGYLTANGYQRTWWARAGDVRITVETEIELQRGVEVRRHKITAPARIEFVEGSRAFATKPDRNVVRAVGYAGTTVEEESGVNVVHGRSWTVALRGKTQAETTTLESRFRL